MGFYIPSSSGYGGRQTKSQIDRKIASLERDLVGAKMAYTNAKKYHRGNCNMSPEHYKNQVDRIKGKIAALKAERRSAPQD